MKLNEFKKTVKDSGQFNINNRVNEIEVSNFINESYYQTKKPFPRKMVFSALSLIIILTMGLFVRLSVHPVTTLTIDINPSIEVDLNVFNRVVDISGTNQAGLEFIEDIDYKNKSIDDVIVNIYSTGVEKAYLTESEAYMLIGVYSDDYQSEVKLGDIFNEITEVNILSIFLHNENDTETQWTLRIASQDSQASLDQMPEVNSGEDGLYSEVPIITYSTSDSTYEGIADLANDYQISQTKMFLVIDIFNSRDDYSTNTDIDYLVNLDIGSLIEMYQALD